MKTTTQPLTLSGIDTAQPFHRERLAYMRAARVLGIRSAYQRKEEAYRFSDSCNAKSLCFASVIDSDGASVTAQAALANDPRRFPEIDFSIRYEESTDTEFVEVCIYASTTQGPERHAIGRLADDSRAMIALLREGIQPRAFITSTAPGSVSIVIAGLGNALAEWLDIYDDRKARAAEHAEAFCREEARQMREEDIWGDVDGYAVQTWGDYVPTGILAAGLDGEPI